MITVPDGLRRSAVDFFGTSGARWADSLPGLVTEYLRQWDLRLDLPPSGQPWHGMVGVVVPVRTAAGEPAVLKISPADRENEHEHTALAVWDGSGAVRLLEADPPRRAMLLERLDGDHDLTGVPVDEAVPVLADLLNRLAVPAPAALGTVAAEAERWVDELPRRWRELGRPAPDQLLERAVDTARRLGPESGDRLVHTDLHYENVLAAPAHVAAAGRGDWLAIDPKPLAGDREFAVVPMLWNRLDDLDGPDRAAALRRRMRVIADAAGLDHDRVREWSIAREVQNIVWYAEDGMDDDRRRSAWVAQSLAG
ncbi:streptomycin 6-kinase [Haloactinopolyspora alba]|uniref:Streptomycin 6-kinase n=1 Tax=Haloactinopolyspora alba TaxID=648780 RepID=A0A2P8DVB1_9ACTN|nr:aminoglycoside phosphotransferase family protein [Haloactinopolyspora alba]PSL01141.1 streptomycin 6-kinase [Haloactinopolyspora alba]